MKYGVQGIPTMLFIANGEVVHKQVGALPEPMLRQVLIKFLTSVAVAN
jgi:thioredoxin 1